MRMTDEQRKLVEDNHDLIYGYLHKKEFNIDEYYDIAAIGLCKAAIKYDLTKSKFSTFAFKCIRTEMDIYHTSLNKKTSVPKNLVCSYDMPAIDDVKEAMINTVLKDNNDNIGYSIENIVFEEFLVTLKNKEKVIVEYLKEGLTQQEIAKKTNKSQQAVSLNIKSIRKKWEEFSNR